MKSRKQEGTKLRAVSEYSFGWLMFFSSLVPMRCEMDPGSIAKAKSNNAN